MTRMNTLEMIKNIRKFEEGNFVEWIRSFSDVLQITWPSLSKIVSGFEGLEPFPRDSRGEKENISELDDNDSSPS